MTDRAVGLAAVALVAAVLLAGVGATGPPVSAQTLDTIAGTQVDPDDVSLGVDLREDGSAAWTVEYRVRLDDDNTTQAFESLRDDIEANDTQYVSEFRGRMVATADTAENATGREMAIRNVSVEATRQELPQEYGVLTYTFVWTNFSVVEDGSITAGDALAGFFLDSETSMQFSWPEGYAVETAQPDPDDVRSESRIVVWNGQVDFGANEPTLVVTERTAGGSTTTTTAARTAAVTATAANPGPTTAASHSARSPLSGSLPSSQPGSSTGNARATATSARPIPRRAAGPHRASRQEARRPPVRRDRTPPQPRGATTPQPRRPMLSVPVPTARRTQPTPTGTPRAPQPPELTETTTRRGRTSS
jgi:hypothetical protein